jgi:hypothetical protein
LHAKFENARVSCNGGAGVGGSDTHRAVERSEELDTSVVACVWQYGTRADDALLTKRVKTGHFTTCQLFTLGNQEKSLQNYCRFIHTQLKKIYNVCQVFWDGRSPTLKDTVFYYYLKYEKTIDK